MKSCRITYPARGGGYKTSSYTTGALEAIHDKRREFGFGAPRLVAFDMDGPLVVPADDLAKTYYDILHPGVGGEKFSQTSDSVLAAVERGECPYGFTLVAIAKYQNGGILDHAILRSVGRHARLTPGANEVRGFASISDCGFTVVTTAYGPTASEVCSRLGVHDCLAIEFDSTGNLKSFTGGYGETKALRRQLAGRMNERSVIFIGDSWTDVGSTENPGPLEHFRYNGAGSISFNPRNAKVNPAASANVYSDNLLGVMPLIGDGIGAPDWIVFNGEEPKDENLVQEEILSGKAMTDIINENAEENLPRADMLLNIRMDCGLGSEPLFDMSEMDVDEYVAKVIEEHSGFIQALKS